MKRFCVLAVALAMLQWVSAASAGVIVFSGGDAGEGLTLTPALVQGIYFPYAPTSLQGVPFPTSSPATVSVPTLSALYPGGYVQLGVSANDSALSNILNDAGNNAGTDIVVTVGNLTAGQSYLVSWLLTEKVGAGFTRNMNFTYNTESSPRDSFTTVNGLGYNVQETVVAQSDGTIEIDANSTGFTPTGGSLTAGDFPIVSAIIVSALPAPVPEPVSFVLIGPAAVGLFFVGWRARRRA